MVEIHPHVDEYIRKVLRFPVKEPAEPHDPTLDAETVVDSLQAPYIEAHAALEKYGIGSAFRQAVAGIPDKALEIGVSNPQKNIGESITLRWDHQEVANGVKVSKGVRMDVRGDVARLAYLFPSNNPTAEQRQAMTIEEQVRHQEQHKYKPGHWRELFIADIKKLTEEGDFSPDAIAEWIGTAQKYSGRYFDHTDKEQGITSDPDVKAKQFNYVTEAEDSQVYIQFEN